MTKNNLNTAKMKYAFAAAAIVASVYAQDISDIPACAVPCIDASRTKVTTCGETDYKCLCDNITAIQGDATTCVISDCGATTAVSEVLPAVQSFCAAVEAGGDTTTAAETTTSAAATTTVAETTTTAAGTATATEATTTAAGGETSAASSEGGSYPTTVISSTSLVPTTIVSTSTKSGHANGTATATTAPSTVVTAGAAVATAGSVGMLVLGALAAFV